MKLTAADLPGAYVIDIEPVADDRGFFARTWDAREFQSFGLQSKLAQCSVSFNTRRGTLRGLHYQEVPWQEIKLVRCSSGAIHDVIVDLRPGSPSYGKSFAIELTAANHKMLYVPEGVAHGFQTLTPDAEVVYQISENYHPESARGIRWNDPSFAVRWPIPDPILSDRDRSFPDHQA